MGFQGFPIESAGSFESDSVAVYLDYEADLTDRLSAAAAIRAEDYDEFGSTTDFKVSGRYQISDTFAIRGTASTGFRAPTPGQVNTLNVTTSSDSAGNLIPFGTYPVSHPIAVALGSSPLTPEESTSYTLGAIFQALENTSITLDIYDIKIEDRLTVQNNNLGPAEVALLTAAGIPNANLLLNSDANFFVNGFESNVSGIDLAIVSDFTLAAGDLTIDFRHNYNKHDVDNIAGGTLSAATIFDFENQVPQHRSVLTASFDSGNALSGFVRLNRYGEWGDSGGQLAASDNSEAVNYSSEILVDIEATWRFNDIFRVSVGADNVFDTEPDADGHFVAELLGVRTAHNITVRKQRRTLVRPTRCRLPVVAAI